MSKRRQHKNKKPSEDSAPKPIKAGPSNGDAGVGKAGLSLPNRTRPQHPKAHSIVGQARRQMKQDLLSAALGKKLQMDDGNGGKISVGTTKEGLGHIVNDVLNGHTKILAPYDAKEIVKILEGAVKVSDGPNTKPRTDKKDYWLYYAANVRGQIIFIGVAQEHHKPKDVTLRKGDNLKYPLKHQYVWEVQDHISDCSPSKARRLLQKKSSQPPTH